LYSGDKKVAIEDEVNSSILTLSNKINDFLDVDDTTVD
jgi:hypothetical protein